MAGKIMQEYREKTHAADAGRTPDELLKAYCERAKIGAEMHENSMRFLMAFTGYKPKNEEKE